MPDIRTAITRAILGGKPGGPHPGGIAVYHSSPHDFDKFDWSKLRTGEGANTYGAGFYFAENPAVSGQGGEYWSAFRNRFSGPEFSAAETLRKAQFDRAKAIDDLRLRIAGDEATLASGKAGDARTMAAYINDRKNELRLLESHNPVGPRTYEVNIAARPELMLDWDKPLSQQSKVVRDILSSGSPEQWGRDPTGREMYQRIVAQARGPDDFIQPIDAVRASDQLRAAGIPGIRYLDQGSRGLPQQQVELEKAKSLLAGAEMHGDPAWIAKQQANVARLEEMMKAPPSYNYVVTDPSRLDIMAKYGVVGGVPMGALAAQDQYGAQQ